MNQGDWEMIFTVIASIIIAPVIFLLNVLFWWTLVLLILVAIWDLISIEDRYSDIHDLKNVGENFVYNLARPFTGSISAVREIHRHIAKAFSG